MINQWKSGIFIYDFEVENSKIFQLTSPTGKNHFEKPVTEKKEKIYLIIKSRKIVYVGITKQPIGNRFRGGQNPIKNSGYHGYKWLAEDGKYKIVILMDFNGYDTETIEAEIVFNIRKEEGQWPSGQTEIHFHNCGNHQKKLAKEIYYHINQNIS
jgi:hypothetical protein